MAGTTTNNGWDYPSSTDLVKDGAVNIQTLAQDIDTSTGKGLIAWQAYTPTLSNITLGTGNIVNFYYCKIGKTVFVRGAITIGTSGGNVVAPADVSLPVTAVGTIGYLSPIGRSMSYNGTTIYPGDLIEITTTTARLGTWNSASTYVSRVDTGNSIPFTWSSGATRIIWVELRYEAA